MAVLSTGQTFSDGEQVTAAKLNTAVNSSTFDSGSVDNASTQLSGGAIIVKDTGITTAKIADSNVTTAKIADANVTTAKILDANVTTAKIADSNVTAAKIADSNVTKAKIENVADMKVLGNTSGTSAAPSEVSVLDEDDLVSNSATSLATQQSIKAYVDGQSSRPEFINFTGGTNALTQTSNGTYIYNIVDFTGTGLDTSKITSIHLSVDINSIYGQENIYAKFPDGTEYVICSISSNYNNYPISHNAVPIIPVNSSQTTFEIRMTQGNGGSRNVTLIGATQIP